MNFDFKQFYFSGDGRIDRKQWWLRYALPYTVIFFGLMAIDWNIGTFYTDMRFGLASGVFGLIAFVPSILIDIKRFHDRDKSGWWMLLLLVPIIGGLWLLIELGFLAGTPGPNRYGAPVVKS